MDPYDGLYRERTYDYFKKNPSFTWKTTIRKIRK